MADRATAHPEQVRLLFDTKAETWSAKYAPDGRLADRLTRLADATGYHVTAGGAVLDLGCGTGELARHLAAVGLRVTGCDISSQMLERAAANDRDGAVAWVRLDPEWRTLPFEPASFDAVLAASVLEYVDCAGVVLAECARILRPGGVMLCTVPDPAHPVRWLEWLAASAVCVPGVRAWARAWPRADRYLTYLRISRQRHPAGWWHTVAARAGLPERGPANGCRATFTLAPLHLPATRRQWRRLVTGSVTVDVAGAWMGGAARYAAELRGYLDRTGRKDVKVIGTAKRVNPLWLLRREVSGLGGGRRVAVNNVSYVNPGGPRWTLLRNALHFLTEAEAAQLAPKLRGSIRREATVVRLTALRADVLVVPSTAMAERVCRALPRTRNRLVVRAHPVSANSIPVMSRDLAILCPVLFAPYKRMNDRLQELLAALDDCGEPLARVRVTASPSDLPDGFASEPRLEFLGRIDHHELREVWARSRAIYFPTGLESFGYPLAEARVSGHPVIARDTAQNREIAGNALCGFLPTDPDSLRHALKLALTRDVSPDPGPFDPESYFEWLLGGSR